MRWATAILLLMIALVLFGPLLYSIDPLATQPDVQLQPPSGKHLLGTDILGRDVLSRVLHGGRFTLTVAVLGTLCAVAFGMPLGVFGGLGKYPIDMMLINAFLAVPGLVIALVILTLLGRGMVPLIVALGVSQAASFAYVMRSAMRLAGDTGFVRAAISLGAPPHYVLWQHILPSTLPTVLAYTGVIFSYTLLNSAALSFLGLGLEPGTPDWGVMLAEGRAAFRTAPWIGLAPGIAITIIVWCVNVLAEQAASGPSVTT